jgi:hypothetical protein
MLRRQLVLDTRSLKVGPIITAEVTPSVARVAIRVTRLTRQLIPNREKGTTMTAVIVTEI